MTYADIFELIINKIERCLNLKGFPNITKNGKWTVTKDGFWTGGFWVGLLWFAYILTDENKYLLHAYRFAKKLEKRCKDKTFDVGFLFYPSFVLGYKVTNDEYFKKVALTSVLTMTTLFDKKIGFIYNIIRDGSQIIGRTIIDVMMNIPLLLWAYSETYDYNFLKIALTHSLRTIEELIRTDGSTIQVLDFDLKSKKILKKHITQGYSNDSCWSRGQAWAVYGFILAYKATKNKRVRNALQSILDYYISNLPSDFVPFWDFRDPNIPNCPKDTSASAIASSGMLELKNYKHVGIKTIKSLIKNYIKTHGDGILSHGCFYKPAGIGINESLIWGDYYFVEALLKIKGNEIVKSLYTYTV